MDKKTKIKNYLAALSVLLIVYGICELISFIFAGRHLFSSAFDYYGLLTRVPITLISAYALSVNMSTGRMDLSLGGQQLAAVIIGGNIALSLGMGPLGIVAVCILFGMLAGLISGLIFVTLRIDAFVLGLGVAMIYEGISAHYNTEGLRIFDSSITGVLSNRYLVFAIGILVFLFMYLLMNKTPFGYKYKAIRGSQRLAINAGINVKLVCLVCYVLSGGLIALAGILSAGISGNLPISVNLGSISIVFSGFLPVMLAYYLAGFVPLEVGTAIGAVVTRFIEILLSKLNVPTTYSVVFLMVAMFSIIIILNILKERNLTQKYKSRSLVD